MQESGMHPIANVYQTTIFYGITLGTEIARGTGKLMTEVGGLTKGMKSL